MYLLPIGYKVGTKAIRADGFLIPQVRNRHTALFGKSGAGKTTLMRNMILWDIWNGSGVTVIDPHGQLIDEIPENIPRSGTNDVIYFKPSHREQVSSLNILEPVPEQPTPRSWHLTQRQEKEVSKNASGSLDPPGQRISSKHQILENSRQRDLAIEFLRIGLKQVESEEKQSEEKARSALK